MTSTNLRSRAPALAFTAIGLALTAHALHAVFGLGGSGLDRFFKDDVYTAIEFAAVAMCAVRVLRQPGDRIAWLLICAGLVAWTAGDLVFTVSLEDLSNPPYPSAADALYLAMYPAMYAGLILLMRSHFRHASKAMWLDGLVVGFALAAVGAELIFPALHAASSQSAAGLTLNLTYLLADCLLLVVIAIGFAVAGWRPGRQWALLAAATFVMAVADMVFLYQEAKGTYVTGRILDTMWPLSLVLFALASWQRAVKRPPRAVAGRGSVALSAAFALLALALLLDATLSSHTQLSVALATCALLAAGARGALTYLENVRMLERQTRDAVTDELTGLGNRRRLLEDLELAVQRGRHGDLSTLAFFDLDGFKRYNDGFGHAAGDALLSRLGSSLAAKVAGRGEAYRLGGDEFCVLLRGRYRRDQPMLLGAQQSLSERGSGFAVTASCGSVVVAEEAEDLTSALKLADERMYADKRRGARSRHSSTQSVLMQLLTEREPGLRDHVREVGDLAVAIGRGFNMDSEELDELRRAAELHDIGKLALPEEILHKPGPLDDSELAFIRQHTIIGERILGVEPALRAVARLVRSSHERWDGRGYPDRLSGADIPRGARIIAACDAYDAMISDRAYRAPLSEEDALAELARHSGTQFDPEVVEALCTHLAAKRTAAQPARGNGAGRAPRMGGTSRGNGSAPLQGAMHSIREVP